MAPVSQCIDTGFRPSPFRHMPPQALPPNAPHEHPCSWKISWVKNYHKDSIKGKVTNSSYVFSLPAKTSSSCVVVYWRFIAQCRLRSLRFTTSCKNISSGYLRVEKFKQRASVAQPGAMLSAARPDTENWEIPVPPAKTPDTSILHWL